MLANKHHIIIFCIPSALFDLDKLFGLTIFWVLHYGALIRELWWWFMPPIIVMVLLFIGLFMITAGLDRIANPRLRTTV